VANTLLWRNDLTKTWVYADPHFGHAGVCKFLRDDGTPLRPWDDPQEMDEALVKNWNERVHPQDRVYLLGDVCINRRAIPTLGRLMGRKVLIKGNHDIFKITDYLPYFDDIRAYVVHKNPYGGKLIMSHIPIHPESLGRFGINVHGHLHYNTVGDPRYVCVSVEHTDYAPLELHEAVKRANVPDA
jgi:calcineurin-like phosphoesterase family protein